MNEKAYLDGEKRDGLRRLRVLDLFTMDTPAEPPADLQLWSPADNQMLMSSEQLEWYHDWRGEAVAERGSEYFLELRDASDAMFLANQYIAAREEKQFGRSPSAVDFYYQRRYGRNSL